VKSKPLSKFFKAGQLSMANINVGQIRHWLFDLALPFWAEHGVDHVNGGPVEEVALDCGISDPGFKRVRVFCRQVYVFSHAYLMGWDEGITLASNMYNAMVQSAWQGPVKGWARTLNSDNSTLDQTTDLYDNAFALFSLGWYYRVSPRAEVLDYMLKTAALINKEMRHPKVGFWHHLPPTGPRIQNPHMHLLEACLACFESTKEPVFETMAKEIIGLFTTYFFDAEQQTLCEYFDDDLGRLTGDQGRIVEPGHQFEWAWILGKAGKMFELDLTEEIEALVNYAELHGVDPKTGATRNSLYYDRRDLDNGSRTWPNTERLKAAVIMFEVFRCDTKHIILPTLNLLFSRYLPVQKLGGWIDAFDADGNPVSKAMPTSTFYHLFLAFAEVLRVSDDLNDLPRPTAT
jgi:mannose/cellobiose epimerase-like protein (N-acyl-D-glucosamine 2-epimerase family)